MIGCQSLGFEVVMAEGTEVEERVDLDEDNYMEDDDVEEQIDDDEDGADGAGYDNDEENVEEVHEDSIAEASGKDQSPDTDRGHIASESIEDEERPTAPIDEEKKEKWAELLALPPHGSEVFIGGLPRDAREEDLRDLCEPIGEVLEVGVVPSCLRHLFFFTLPLSIRIFKKGMILQLFFR